MPSEPHPNLRSKLGPDALRDLHDLIDSAGHEWKDGMIEAAIDRFERRLSDEIGILRADLAREIALIRVELERVRVEMAQGQSTMLRWLFGFLITVLAAIFGMMTFLVNLLKA